MLAQIQGVWNKVAVTSFTGFTETTLVFPNHYVNQ